MEKSKTKVETYTLVFTDYEKKIEVRNLKEMCKFVLKKYNPSNYPETFITPENEEIEWKEDVARKYIFE